MRRLGDSRDVDSVGVSSRGDVAIAVVLIDKCVELVACHTTLAASTLQVEEECGRRGEGCSAFVGQRALELTERLVFEGLLVLSQGLKVDELPVTGFAAQVGFLELCLFDSSGLELGLCKCSVGDDLCMAVTGKVMIESLITREAALAVGTLKARDMYIGPLVRCKVCRSIERLVVLGAVTVVGCLLMTQTIDQHPEHLSADWTSIVLVLSVLVARLLVLEGQFVDADSTLVRVGARYCEVKEPARLAFVVVGDIAFVVHEGVLAFDDGAAVALEEVAE